MMRALPDADARAQALDLRRHVLAMAPAGSGKTGLLVQRMLLALAEAQAPEQVVAITFTNKAAAEIRNRILELLREAADGGTAHERPGIEAARALLARDAAENWRLLEQPDRLRALTIDAFCAQLAAQLPLLSGLGGALRIADDAWPMYAEAITRGFAEIEDDSLDAADRDAYAAVLRLAGNRLDRLIGPLADLLARREQWLRQSLRSDGEEWRQAESTALQTLIEHRLQAFDAVLDAGAKSELVEVLRLASSQAEEFSWAAQLAAWPAPQAAALPLCRKLAELLVTKQGELRKSGGVNIKLGFGPKLPHTLRFKALLDGLAGSDALAACCGEVLRLPDAEYPEALRELRDALLRVMKRLAGHLRVVFGLAGQTDFAEIATSAINALRPDGNYGEALLAADARLRHLLVDEMQDTSEGQLELLHQLTAGWQAGDGRSLFLVGDPQQSIYAFRKAEVRLFLDLWQSRRLGALPLERVQLTANFRSDPAVVGWFNDAFTRIFPTRADAELGIVPFAPSVAMREPRPGCGVELRSYAADEDEAAAEAAAADAQRLIGQGSVVVLARARNHLEPVIRALRARGLTPNCQDIDPLAALPEVRDYLALARALWHPSDRLSWAALLRAPFVGLSWSDMVALSRARVALPWPQRIAQEMQEDTLSVEGRQRLQRLLDALDATRSLASLRADLAERAEALWHALGGPGCVSRDALDDVLAAMRLLRAHTRGGGIRDLESLERGLAQLYAAPRAGQVQLMTVHKAKGLEFEHVLLVGMNKKSRSEDRALLQFRVTGDGELLAPLPPDSWPQESPAWRLYDFLHGLHVESRAHEALRLLYVAITRARSSATLYVCADAGKSGAPAFAAGSFARLLEPVIAPAFVFAATPMLPAETVEAGIPHAPRLVLDYRYTPEDDLYRPKETLTLKPSEAVLGAQEQNFDERNDGGGDIYAQLVGTLYHEALEIIAQDGFAAWADAGRARRGAMLAGLRRRGLPESQVGAAADRVLELIARTLASERGRWLLAPKPWARNEYHLAGWREGRWISAVIDRCFEDDDGTLWVIDYKAAARPLAAEALESYVANGVVHYEAQLREYASLLGELRGKPARAALYFPEADRLAELAQASP